MINPRRWREVPATIQPHLLTVELPDIHHPDDWLFLKIRFFYLPDRLRKVARKRYARIYRKGPHGPVIPNGTNSARRLSNIYLLSLAGLAAHA